MKIYELIISLGSNIKTNYLICLYQVFKELKDEEFINELFDLLCLENGIRKDEEQAVSSDLYED